MLYTKKQLNKKGFVDSHVAVQRYLHKFLYHRKEINKLKWHEKDFFFEHLQILKDNNGQFVFDLYSIPEAKDYLLYKLILTYASNNNTIDFDHKAFDYNGEISKNRRMQDRQKFIKLFKGVNYSESLNKMQSADCLVSIDAPLNFSPFFPKFNDFP